MNKLSGTIIAYNEEENIRVSQWTLIGRFIVKFLELYFWKRGFLDGLHGLIAAIAASYFAFIKYAKVWEMQAER